MDRETLPHTAKLEAVQIVNLRNAKRARTKFTGDVTTHWFQGEPKEEIIVVHKPVRRVQ